MLMKRVAVFFVMLFCFNSSSYCISLDNNQDANKLDSFITWQKQLNWNSGSVFNYFWDGSVTNAIIPLSGQWGVWTGNAGAELWSKDPDSKTPVKKTHWTYDYGGEIPTILFGEKAGASPLYCGITYRFGVHTGTHALREVDFAKQKHLQIKVYDLEMSAGQNQPVYVESVWFPLNKFQKENSNLKSVFGSLWDEYINKAGGIIKIGSGVLSDIYGLDNWMQYTESRSAFGYGDSSGIIFFHRANKTKYGYVIQLLNDAEQKFDTLYAADFSPLPPDSAAFILQSQFMREPRPSGYWGMISTDDEQLRNFGMQSLFMEETWHQKYWAKYQDKNLATERLLNKFNAEIPAEESDITHISTLYKKNLNNTPANYAELDQFIKERQDPLILASYVQNEIELIDGIGVPETNRSPEWVRKEYEKYSEDERKWIEVDATDVNTKYKNDILTPGKINRSPLVTFLEGQGSPWEQCDLLVYMLRQAGYAAAYVESEEPFIFSRDDFSRLLHMQLTKPNMGLQSSDDKFIRVRYPWVAYYDENKHVWVHLFPWIKDTKIIEGYDLYNLMPEGYKSGIAWVRHYMENDPNILKHVKEDGNDTAAVLLKRFVDELAKEKGIDPEAVGVRYQNIKKGFSSWEDFPKPLCFEGGVRFSDAISKRSDLFTTVKIKINSLQNPQKEIATEVMRLADIYGRVLYLSFNPISEKPDETRHEMALRMEGASEFFSKALGGFDEKDLVGAQEKKILLDGGDHKIKLTVSYDQKMEGSYTYPFMRSWDIYETSYTIDKGSLASICMNIGRITKKMLDFHVARYNRANSSGSESPSDALGRLTYLIGMSYFERLSFADKTLRELYKVNNVTGFRVGLSKLSPDLADKSPNRNSLGEFIGRPILVFPQVDMKIFETNQLANGGIRPDLGEEISSAKRDYYVLRLVDGSSNEHQIINDFYGDKYAVSTVKLLQLAHKRHVASGQKGTGFLVFTRSSLEEANHNPQLASERYFSHIKGLNLAHILQEGNVQWEIACKGLNWDSQTKKIDDDHDSYYSIIYMTPGDIYSEDGNPNDDSRLPSYKGTGTLVFTPNMAAAMISSNQNFMDGGYGSRLSSWLFHPSNYRRWNVYWGDSGFKMDNFDSPIINQANYFDTSKAETVFNDVRSYSEAMPRDVWSSLDDKVQQNWNFDTNVKENAGDRFTDLYKTVANDGPLFTEAHINYQDAYSKLADPVDIVSGAFQIQEEDLSLVGPLPLTLKRNYSSVNPFSSELGYGWKRNLTPYLVLSPQNESEGISHGDIIQAAELDGTVILYRKKSEDRWEVLPKDNSHLVTSGDDSVANNVFGSYIRREAHAGHEDYYLYGADGSLRMYQVRSFPIASIERKRPYLYSMQDASGNTINFEYGENKDSYDYGQVNKIVGVSGDFIGLRYDEHSHIVEVYARDGRCVHYAYDTFGDLESVTRPDGTIIKYTYEHKISNQNVLGNAKPIFYSTHKITFEEKPNGRILQNVYDESERVIEQKVTPSQGKLVTNAKFSYYDEADKNLITSREVRDALGNLTRYKLYGSLITHIVDPLGHSIYQSWYLDKDGSGKQSYFDAKTQSIKQVPENFAGLPNQLMQRVDKRGLCVNYSYDNQGNLRRKWVEGQDLSGDGKSQNLVTNYTYTDLGFLASITTGDLDTNSKVFNNNFLSANPFEVFPASPVTDKNPGRYFFYQDSKYPKLVTRTERRIGDDIISTTNYTYGNIGDIKGLLFKETSFDPKNPGNHLEIGYDYNSRGLLSKKTQKIGDNKNIVTKFEYDLQGNLSREIVDSGAYTKYLHDNMNRLTGIIKYDAHSKELSATYYHYNANGELEWIKGPADERDYTLLNYDTSGNQVFKAKWRFKIDDSKYLGMKVVPIPGYQSFVSQAIELRQYDDLSRLVYSFDPEGHVSAYTYDALGQTIRRTVSEKLGGKILEDEHYEYEPGGFVAKTIRTDKGITTRSYTTNGLLKREDYPDGKSHSWVYDVEGRIVSETTERGAQWDVTYDDINHVITRKEIKTGVTEIRKLDIYGNTIEEVDGNGSITRYTYDTLGRLLSKEQNAETSKYNYKYDESGNEIKENMASDGARTQETIRSDGRLLAMLWFQEDATKPMQTRNYLYHPDGRICVVGGNNETQSCYFSDPNGRRLLDFEYFLDVQNPGNLISAGTSYDYDRLGNLLSYNTASLLTTSFSYDGLGRRIKESFSNRFPTLLIYDDIGRLIRRDLPMGLIWHKEYKSLTESSEESMWDGHPLQGWHNKENNANNRTTTDLNGHVFSYQTDVLGRIIEIVVNGKDGYQENSSFSYDQSGHLTKVRQKTPIGETLISRVYDGAGHILNEKVSYDGITISDWQQKWIANHRVLLSTTNSKGNNDQTTSWNFKHNANGLLAKINFSNPHKNLEWSYVYSQAGLLKERHTPWQTILLDYDPGGRVIKQNVANLLLGELIWNLDGKTLSAYRFTRENGPVRAMIYKYDERGRLFEEIAAEGDTYTNVGIADYFIDWDTQDGLGICTDTAMQGLYNYQHSIPKPQKGLYARAELETFSGISKNRLLFMEDAEEQLQQTSLNTSYDAMGRVIERTFKEFSQKQILKWDPRGRLLNVTLKDTTSESIISEWQAVYDGFDRRIRTIFTPYKDGTPDLDRAITQTSLYDPEVEFLELGFIVQIGKEQPRTVWKIYGASNNGIYGENNGYHSGLEAIIDGDTNRAYGIVNSLQGNIAIVIDDNKQIYWQKEVPLAYGPIEVPIAVEMDKINDAGDLLKAVIESSIWQSRRIDPTGFINFGARYYEPLTKRFLSCDPFGHSATPDLYSYADGDPVNRIDSDGRFTSKAYEAVDQTVTAIGENLNRESVVRAATGGAAYLACESAVSAGTVLRGGNLGDVAVVAACSHPMCIGIAQQAYSTLYFSGEGGDSKESSAGKASNTDTAEVHGHHAYPKYMGGHPRQNLIDMPRSEHVELHKDLVRFLKENHPEMVTKPGYSGRAMQRDVPENLRQQALKDFYSGSGAKYKDAAQEFFKQTKK